MLPRRILGLAVCAGLLVLTAVPGAEPPLPSPGTQPPGASPSGTDAPKIPVLKLAVPKGDRAERGLKVRLWPDPLDQVHGNAAPLWMRAGLAARLVNRPHNDKEYKWADASEMPLKDLPRKEVQAYLDAYKTALELADLAARRDRCDWEMPPLTIQGLNNGFQFDDVQIFRQVAQLLNVRTRLELSEGHFDKAVATVRTGLMLARHVSEGDTLIHTLVGIAIGAIMLGRVEEIVQVPGSPNLYWALTTLPQPFIDARRPIVYEMDTLYRSFPELRRLDKQPLQAAQVDAIAAELIEHLKPLLGQDVPLWQGKLALTGLVLKTYPDAKRYLLAHGCKDEQVEAMPSTQVVFLYFLAEYDGVRDETIQWLSLPPWQGRAGLDKLDKRVREMNKSQVNVLVRLLFPAIFKVYEAHLRVNRQIAGLRAAEALRLYAAAHKGQPPAKWADVTEVPLPIDPTTGKGFDEMYQVKGGTGVLEVPTINPLIPQLGRRYELIPPRRD